MGFYMCCFMSGPAWTFESLFYHLVTTSTVIFIDDDKELWLVSNSFIQDLYSECIPKMGNVYNRLLLMTGEKVLYT